jgi:hypothetical protein
MLIFLSTAFMFQFEFEEPIWIWNKKNHIVIRNIKEKGKKMQNHVWAESPFPSPANATAQTRISPQPAQHSMLHPLTCGDSTTTP